MTSKVEQSIIAMMNGFPQTSQDYQVLLKTLLAHSRNASDEAVIETARRFSAGQVEGQSMRFSPTSAEFMDEVRKRQEFIDQRSRPRLPAPVYRPGPKAPFQIAREKALEANKHLPILFEDISHDRFRQLAIQKQIPIGAKWVAACGNVYGPAPISTTKAA